MAAQEQQQETPNLLSSYLGLSFSIFLTLLPKNSITLLSNLQNKNKNLTFKFKQAEEQLKQLHSRRKEDSKANARVVEIFASHRHSWQQEEKRLLEKIDECNEEMAYLKGRVEEFERGEREMKSRIEELKRGVLERDEILNFMRSETVSGDDGVEESFGQDFLSSDAGSRFWSEKDTVFQDVRYEPVKPIYHMKHFVSRRESPWKVDSGVSLKLKLVEQEILNLERVCKAEAPLSMLKQTKRYQALAGKMDDLCHRMQACNPCESTLSSEFRTQRQTEFLLEAFRLQQHASETNQKLMALQSEAGGEVKSTRRGLDSIKNNLKEIQRSIEIWLARIIGDLEGIMARDGVSSQAREYYMT